ncbi:HAD domain-containing protein [Sphingobacterium rhinopitheci]|uniref:HAD domain-containing protein n=1 Tax=Sphingobacterium rhinopitheci TaxID=2781960 RepID=UPI001F523DC6|nr:HAD domain-containing protein [Sphingobacterium rhinopitheci]MCI0922550.1 hypothetical protein [Sphingobacterium rhinopitheci]
MIFFLDIDGVMVHANPHKQVEIEEDGFYKFNSLAVSIINAAISKKKDEIVLSTSHRFKYDVLKWKEIFKSRGIAVNKISIIENNNEFNVKRLTRRCEIEQWIEYKQLDTDDFVIIDDDKSLNDLPQYIKDRLVLTSSYRGLAEFDLLGDILHQTNSKYMRFVDNSSKVVAELKITEKNKKSDYIYHQSNNEYITFIDNSFEVDGKLKKPKKNKKSDYIFHQSNNGYMLIIDNSFEVDGKLKKPKKPDNMY